MKISPVFNTVYGAKAVIPQIKIPPAPSAKVSFKGAVMTFDPPPSLLKTAFNTDVFIKNKEEPKEVIFFEEENYENESGLFDEKVTLENYLSLTDGEKDYIYSEISPETKYLALLNIEAGLTVKSQLDKKYGETGYKFISLGTSPSCAAKAMELMGADVIYLPMSFSKEICAKPWLDKSPYIPFYKEYMNEKGLSNEALVRENKKGIICDYTVTGRSLELSEYMLKGPLGIDPSLLETVTFNSLIENSKDLSTPFKTDYLEYFLKTEQAAGFSSVPHFSFLNRTPFESGQIKSSDALKEYFDSYTSKYSNPHDFSLMYQLEDFGAL